MCTYSDIYITLCIPAMYYIYIYYVYAYHYSTIHMYIVEKNVLMICFRKMLSFVKILILKFLKYVTIT